MIRSTPLVWGLVATIATVCCAQERNSNGNQAIERFRATAEKYIDMPVDESDPASRESRLEAIRTMDEALQTMIANQAAPEVIADSAEKLGNAYSAEGCYDQAIDYLTRAVEAYERLPGSHPSVRNARFNLALSRYMRAPTIGQRREPLDAMESELKAIVANGGALELVAGFSETLGDAMDTEGRQKDAIIYWTTAAEAYEKLPGGGAHAATIRFQLALARYESAESRDMKIEALNAAETELPAMTKGPAGPKLIAMYMQNLGSAFYFEQCYAQAALHLERAAEAHDGLPGGHPQAVENRFRAGQARYKAANSRELRLKALEAMEKEIKEMIAINADQEQTAKRCERLWLLFMMDGVFAKALEYGHLTNKIYETIYTQLPADRRQAAVRAKLNLAGTYMRLADHTEALKFYKAALDVAMASYGPTDLKTAEVQVSLGSQLLRMDRVKDARGHLLAAFEIRTRELGPTNLLTLESLNKVLFACLFDADSCQQHGRVEEARNLIELAKRHVDAAMPLCDLGEALQHEKPPLDIGYLRLMAGQVYHRLAQIDQARRWYEKGLDTLQRSVGDSAPLLLMEQSVLLAVLEGQAGNAAKAAERFTKIRRFMRSYALESLPGLPESQVLTFLHNADMMSLHAGLSLIYLSPSDGAVAEQTAEWVVNSKAVTVDVLNARLGKGKEPIAWLPLEQVRNALPKDAIIIEVVKVRPFGLGDSVLCWSKETKYAAWVIPPAGEGDVRVFDLGPSKPIDEKVMQFVFDKIDSNWIDKTGKVRNVPVESATLNEQTVIWPILDELSGLVLRGKHDLASAVMGKRHWIISGDAMLTLLPWPALRLDGKYVIEQHLIEYVNSSRDLFRSSQPIGTGPPLLVAFPDVNLSSDGVRNRRTRLLPRQ